jgi:hypothetical protein
MKVKGSIREEGGLTRGEDLYVYMNSSGLAVDSLVALVFERYQMNLYMLLSTVVVKAFVPAGVDGE